MAEAAAAQATNQSSGSSGNQTSSGGAAAQTSGAQSGQMSATGQTQQTQQATAPSRPDWLPETYFDAKAGPKWDDFGKHYGELATRDAAEQVRRNSLPANPDAYKVSTSPAFKAPTGVEFKLNEADPAWTQARAWAHKHGLSQEAFAEGIDFVAARDLAQNTAIEAARTAELAKLGPNATARIDALNTFFTGLLGPEQGRQIGRMMVTSDIVEALEKAVAKFSSQGAASFPQHGREPPEPAGRVSQEQYDKMTPAQRIDYNRRFDQSQMPKWRDPRAA